MKRTQDDSSKKRIIITGGISDYLGEISELTKEHRLNNSFFVYRGESKIYKGTSGIPNVLRNDRLNKNSQFERNLYLLLSQNEQEKDNLLHNAINAQHDEFSSRLLDVSYNCLIALYFAVTPYYHRDEDSLDDCNGIVYIYEIDEIYSPAGKNTQEAFDATIKKDESWFNDAFFARKHKFIDHNKQNSRIIAQQGAFLLFQGEGYSQIPEYMKREIEIDSSAKKQMRQELKDLFGIYTGSVYPEITNTVSYFSEKSMLVNSKSFNEESEIISVLDEMDKELDYLLYDDVNENILIEVERIMSDYKDELLSVRDNITKGEDVKKRISAYYNAIIEKYSSLYDKDIMYSFDDFEINLKNQLIDDTDR